jgi:hypothetical protein
MKAKLQQIATFLLVTIYANTGAQNLYVLNLSDASNYTVDCGTATPSQWSVKSNYCSLITTGVNYPGNPFINPPMIAPVTINFNSTGNLDCAEIFPEGAFIKYSINGGAWFTQNHITSCSISGLIHSVQFNLFAQAGANIRLMISIAVTSKTEKIWIKTGDIIIGTPVEAGPSNWVKKMDPASGTTAVANEAIFKVYPNPSDGKNIILSLTNAKEDRVLIALYDLLGREVFSKVLISDNGSFLEAIDPQLAPGTYIITGTAKDEVYRKTLIVQ